MADKAPGFSYSTSGRSLRARLVLAAVYGGLIGAYLVLDAALFILAVLALFTLPALWDYITDRPAGVALTEADLSWFTGERSAEMQLSEIDHVRLDTKLDFSVRSTIVDRTGKKTRLPYESLPHHRLFEAALNAHGIRTERHHFSLL